MPEINLQQEWDFVISQTHNKYKRRDALKRELIFMLQILLSKISVENKNFLTNVYLKSKRQYLI